jgi:hypothetical protein
VSLAIQPDEVVRIGERARVGGPPHEDDVWISTEDAYDYAVWLNRRAEALDAEFVEWLNAPAHFGAALEWNRETGFGRDPWRVSDPWIERWRRYFGDLTESWWARVNSWEETKARHAELLEFVAVAEAKGLPVEKVEALPEEVTDKVPGAAESATGLLYAAGFAALGVAAILAVKAFK